MLDKNEMLDFFDGWNDKPENIGRGSLVQKLPGLQDCGVFNTQEIGRGMRHPWFNTDKEMRNHHQLETAIPSHTHNIAALVGGSHSHSVKGSPEKDDTDNSIFISNPTEITGASLVASDMCLQFHDSSTSWAAVSATDFDTEVSTLKAELMELRAELDDLKPKAVENVDTGLMIKRSSEDYDDSMVRMKILKSRDSDHDKFMFKAPCLDSLLDHPQYPTEDLGATVAYAMGASAWYDTIERKMYDVTATQAMQEQAILKCAPPQIDHFAELEQAVRLQAAQLSTAIDNVILADLKLMIDNGILNEADTVADFDYAMELAK